MPACTKVADMRLHTLTICFTTNTYSPAQEDIPTVVAPSGLKNLSFDSMTLPQMKKLVPAADSNQDQNDSALNSDANESTLDLSAFSTLQILNIKLPKGAYYSPPITVLVQKNFSLEANAAQAEGITIKRII